MGKKVVGNEYLKLVRRFPLRPIRSAAELDKATKIIDELIAFEERSAEADDYLDVLSDLVQKYEAEHHSIPEASPAEVLQFLIEDRQTNQRAVALGAGIAVSTISEILTSRREMNLEHMKKLARFFSVNVGVFVPSDTTPVATVIFQAAGPRVKDKPTEKGMRTKVISKTSISRKR
jgi:HTH-type transcriptional regulator/antitoxin HigA